MLKLISWELNNIVFFKKAKVSILKAPLIFTRGLNLDSDPASPTGNGAGKTTLFTPLPNLWYFSTPLSLRKNSKKDLLGKGSSITVTFRAEDGSKYKITQAPGKYTILRDGEDLDVKKIPVAEKMIRELFPLSEVLFYSTCFISTQRSFPFQQDSDSARLEHLVDMFRLDQYDRIREYFSQKQRELKDNEVKLSVLEQRLSILQGKVKAAKTQTVKFDSRSIQAKIEALEPKIHSADKRKHDLGVTLNALKTLVVIERELDDLRSNYKYGQPPEVVLAGLKKKRSLVRKYENYLALKEQYDKSSRSLRSKIDSLELPPSTKEEILQLKSKVVSLLKELRAQLDAQRDLHRQYKELVSEGKEVAAELLETGIDVNKGDVVDHEEDLESQLSVYRTTLRLERLVSHTHESSSATCPTCLSEIDLKSTKDAIRAAKKAIPKLELKAKAQTLFQKYRELRAGVKRLGFSPAVYESLKEKLTQAEAELVTLDDHLETWRTHATYVTSLSSLKKPEQPEPTGTDLTSTQLDDEMELCSTILKHLEAKLKLTHAHPELADLKKVEIIKGELSRVTAALKVSESAALSLRKSLSVLTQKLEQHTDAEREFNLYSSELVSTQASITELQPTVQSKRLFEVLLKAYGAKGLRTIAANEICGLIETNLNYYRGLCFAEPFIFSVQASEAGLSIMVDRGNGKVSDVRTLSGAESNFFRLLFVLAVLPLLPSDRRTNFLILDEPTSHADEVSRVIFRERFLPAIQQVVPHTVVISPHQDDFLPDSVEWIVKKHNGVSEVLFA